MAGPLRAVGPNEEDLPSDEQEEVLSQSIQVEVGGKSRRLPVRTIRQEREWMEILQEKANSLGNEDLDLSPAGYARLMELGSEAMLDLVVAYDRTNALGGREYVEETATRREVYEIFRRLLDEHFPFGMDLQKVVGQLQGVQGLLALARANSAPARSGSGSGPSGAQPVKRSRSR